MKVSLDGGVTFKDAPEGVRVSYEDIDLPLDGRVGHLAVVLTHEGIILDAWAEVGGLGCYVCIGTSSETVDEAAERLVRDGAETP